MTAATKQCPFCGEEILAAAQKCRYCRTYLDPSLRQHMAASSATERMLMPVGRPASAIAAGYLGLLSFTPLFGALTGIAAVVTGISALKTIRKDPSLHGKGRAWFGIIIGAPLAVLWTVAFVALLIAALSKTPH